MQSTRKYRSRELSENIIELKQASTSEATFHDIARIAVLSGDAEIIESIIILEQMLPSYSKNHERKELKFCCRFVG
jgi:hypothetical protein